MINLFMCKIALLYFIHVSLKKWVPIHIFQNLELLLFFGGGWAVLGLELRAWGLVSKPFNTSTTPPSCDFFFFFSFGWATPPSYLTFNFFGSTGVWAQFFMLTRQALYHVSQSTSPVLCRVLFEIGSLELFVQAGLEPWTSWSLPQE
jgi:hypothetical protein